MKKLFTMITATLLMAACAEDITTSQTDGNKQYVTFSVSDANTVAKAPYAATRTSAAPWAKEQTERTGVEKKVVAVETDFPIDYPLSLTITDEPYIRHADADRTRGTLLNSGDAASLEFGVTEFLTSDATVNPFSNSKPTHQRTLDDGRELFKANEFWEYDSYDDVSYDFYAYAPWVNGTGQGITLSNGNRTIAYNPTGVAVGNQPDLMTARKWSSSYVGAIPLNFQHRLCAIQIKTGATWSAGDFKISGIQFQNIYYQGTFDIDTDKDDAWTSYNESEATPGNKGNYTATGFVANVSTGNTVVAGDATVDDKKTWLMLPPQTLEGAKLTITLSDGTNAYTFTASINTNAWKAGHTVTYTVGPESIEEITVKYPTGYARSWNDGSNPVTGPVTTYTDADRFGLFVLDKNNNILISNQCVSPTAGSDAASRTLNITSVFKSKQFSYFLMYPYISDDALQTLVGNDNYNNYYALNGTGRPVSADDFFAEVIANWTPANDQSDAAVFKKQDLQIAKLSGDYFNMVHKMGILGCTLPDGITSNDVITYDGNSYDGDAVGEKWTKIDSKCTTITWNASTTFTSTDKPYISGTALYYIAKPGNATIAMSTSSSTSSYDWSVSGASTTVSTANAYKAFTIASPDLSNYYNKKVWEFSYVGAGKQWKAPFDGTYRMECWGAGVSGASSGTYRGRGGGGYVAGDLNIDEGVNMYVYVGQTYFTSNSTYAFNGGGYSSGSGGPTGCGATYIRTTYTVGWSNIASLRSRIIVAGGGSYIGSSASCYSSAGGLNGYDGYHYNGGNYQANCGKGGHQTSGGAVPTFYTPARTNGTAGQFGYGGRGGQSSSSSSGAGGGGGWYGASGSSGASSGSFAGGGGSSFISGHTGCNGINSSGTHQGASNPSKVLFDGTGSEQTITFTNTLMIDGAGYKWTSSRGSLQQMPNPEGGYYVSGGGHSSHGFARITYTRP